MEIDRALHAEENAHVAHNPKIKVQRPYVRQSDATLITMAQRFGSKSDMGRSDPPLHAELVARRILDQVFTPDNQEFPRETVIRKAMAYNSVDEMRLADPYLASRVADLGLTGELFPKPHTGVRRKWTIRGVIEAARGCSSRTELHSTFAGAYAAARTFDVLELACEHMPRKAPATTPHGMTDEQIVEAAGAYDGPSAFRRGNRTLYNLAMKRRLFPEIRRELGWKVK